MLVLLAPWLTLQDLLQQDLVTGEDALHLAVPLQLEHRHPGNVLYVGANLWVTLGR